jgi:hypothetical protein
MHTPLLALGIQYDMNHSNLPYGPHGLFFTNAMLGYKPSTSDLTGSSAMHQRKSHEGTTNNASLSTIPSSRAQCDMRALLVPPADSPPMEILSFLTLSREALLIT